MMAMAGRITIAEVEHLVEPGDLDPDLVHTPAIFVQRIFQARAPSHFIERRTDVLVTTLIIESGLDIPTVNTMLMNRADALGLAQIYQLRGRIGRSHHQAFCYLLVPPGTVLSEDAEKRLRVIAEHEELGAGLTY